MKAIIISAFIIIGCVLSNAQAQSYKINKENYNHRMYMPQPGDPYNPTVMGISSFLVPGLGQILSGETGRGLAFMGGTLGTGVIVGVGLLTGLSETTNSNELEISSTGLAVVLAGGAIMLGLSTWSSLDAMKVAKINNMYIQDKRGKLSSVKLELNPFVDTNNYLGQISGSAGLSLKVTF